MRNIWLVCLALVALAGCGDSDQCQSGECACVGDDCGGDHCSPNPCSNGGTCANAGSSFACTCPVGFGGATCETDIDDCVNHGCQNGGACVDGLNGYSCACNPAFTGAMCETDVDECAAAVSPCGTNAVCANAFGSHTCTCVFDYAGDGITCVSTLMGEWRFEGDASDSSPANHDGIAENTTETYGWARGGLVFTPAATSRVRIPYIDLRSKSFTVQAWVRPAIGTNLPVFTQCETATADHCLSLGVSSNRASMSFGDTALTGEQALANGRWHHLAWVYDADRQTQSIYVDGVLDLEENNHTPYLGASGETVIGRHLLDAVSADATIDEVKLFAAARLPALIATDAHDVVRYDFTGGTATDRGVYHRDGTIASGVTTVAGIAGDALLLDPAANGGYGAYVSTPHLAALVDGGAFTIEIWARANAATGATLVNLVDNAAAPTTCTPYLGLTADGRPAAQVNDGGDAEGVSAPDPIVPGTWTRITQSFRDDHGVRLFVDGELVTVAADFAISNPDLGSILYAVAGTAPNTCATDVITRAPFDGAIDNLRIDRGERSADDIAASRNFDHACSYILAEHPSFTTAARDLALCGGTYEEENMAEACNVGWHVCSLSEWRARVLPEGFDPEVDQAPAIDGPLTSWGAPQARRCTRDFWEADRPLTDRVWDDNPPVCNDAYNPWNNGKYLYADGSTTVLEGNGDCCNWDSDFTPFMPDPSYDDAMAVYCCK